MLDATNEIGGQQCADTQSSVQGRVAPKQRGRRKASPAAPDAEIAGQGQDGAGNSVQQDRARKQRGAKRLSAASTPEIGGQQAANAGNSVHRPPAPKQRKAVARASAASNTTEIAGYMVSDAKNSVLRRCARKQRGEALASPAALTNAINRIVILQRERLFCINQQIRAGNAVNAYIARMLGANPEMPEAERRALWNKAIAYRQSVERQFQKDKRASAGRKAGEGDSGEAHNVSSGSNSVGQPAPDLSASHRLIVQAMLSREPWDDLRLDAEKQMEALAETLPVWSWVQTVAGFGAKGLAIVIAEAGAGLHCYPRKEHLWKRLGLAVINGERQRKVNPRTDPEAWIEHGYSPKRRAEMWTLCDSLFRHQWRGEKDGEPAHAIGPYGEVYARRKAHTKANRDWQSARHHEADARRIMWKAVLKDLHRAWKRTWPKDGADG